MRVFNDPKKPRPDFYSETFMGNDSVAANEILGGLYSRYRKIKKLLLNKGYEYPEIVEFNFSRRLNEFEHFNPLRYIRGGKFVENPDVKEQEYLKKLFATSYRIERNGGNCRHFFLGKEQLCDCDGPKKRRISEYIFSTHKKWLLIIIDDHILEINRKAPADAIRSQIKEYKNAIKSRREESPESMKTCFSDFLQMQDNQNEPLANSKCSIQEIPHHEISETKEKEPKSISKENCENSFVPACVGFSCELLKNPDPLIQSMGEQGIYLNLGYLSK